MSDGVPAPATPNKNQVSLLEKAERVSFVRQLMGALLSHTEIKRQVMARYRCTEGSARNYLKAAYAEAEADGTKQRPMRRNMLRSALEKCFRAAFEKGQIVAAIMALDRLAKLDGLNAPDRVEIATEASTAEKKASSMTTDERRRRIMELAQRGGYAPPPVPDGDAVH